MTIQIGDIIMLRGTNPNQYGIVVERESDGYIIYWFDDNTKTTYYHYSHLLKVT